MWQGGTTHRLREMERLPIRSTNPQTAGEREKRSATEESNTKTERKRELGLEAKLKLHIKSKSGHSFIAPKAVSCPRYSLCSGLNIFPVRSKFIPQDWA